MKGKTKKESNVPNLRFKEFEGEWERKQLGDLCKMQAGKFVSASEINEKPDANLFPCYGGNGLRGYTKSFNYNGKHILIGRQGALCGNVTLAKGKFYATEHAVVVTSNSNIDTDWIYFLLFHLNLNQYATGQAQPGLSVQNLEKVEALIPPSKKEQQSIATVFCAINDRIQTQSKIIEELKFLKRSLLKKIFLCKMKFKDDKGNDYPEWQNKRLGEITVVVNKRNKNNERLPVYSISNRAGFVPQSEQFEGIDSDERGYDIKLYKIIDKNTFAYNPARINVGSIGYSGNLQNIIISSLYVCFKTNDSVNDQFLFQYLRTDLFNFEVLKNVEGGVRNYLFYENFAQIKLDLPCIEEQLKIANFLSAIDQKIEIETTILKKLNQQKKYLLHQMFI